jgi:SH3-like domain-containing protein
MKQLFFLLLATLLVLPTVAAAGDQASRDQASGDQTVMLVKIIDKDPNGTNLRDGPSGKVIYTVPFKPNDELERDSIAVSGKKGQWFKVELESGKKGWMHTSVLGLRGGSTEDGPCTLKQKSSEEAKAVIKPGKGAVLQLLDYTTDKELWIKVRYTDAKGVKHDGWIPQQCR